MPRRNRICVFATEPVTGRIGGLGIRQLEIARVLSRHFTVRLLTPYPIGAHTENFPLHKINYESPATIEAHVRWADAVYANNPSIAPLIRRHDKPLAVDLLVHEYFEDLEFMPLAEMGIAERAAYFSDCIMRLSNQLALGDFFLAPSERSRDYYLGALTCMGKLHPRLYADDPHFRGVIDVAPFGLPAHPPKSGKNLLRGKLPGVGMDDFLMIWGGSLANWFDPLTLLRAMTELKTRRPKIKLVFTGRAHPMRNELTAAATDALRYARRHRLLDKTVFFYQEWVPFQQRDYYLTESDAGVVTFRDHIENRFSQRIRILDYLWGELPILTNPGNVFSDFIEKEKLGLVAPCGDARALAAAIERLADRTAERQEMRRRIAAIKPRLTWEETLRPLIHFCRHPRRLNSLYKNGHVPNTTKLIVSGKLQPEQMVRLVPAHPQYRPLAIKKLLAAGDVATARTLTHEQLRLFGDGLDNIIFRQPLSIPGDLTLADLKLLLPHHRMILLLQAVESTRNGDLETAEKLTANYARLYGEDTESLFAQGLLEQRRGRHKEAARHLRIVCRRLPQCIECLLPLADALARLGQGKTACHLYKQAWRHARKHQNWARTHAAAAIARLEQRFYPEHESLRAFLAINQGNVGLIYSMASAYERAGDKKKARHYFRALTRYCKDVKICSGTWFRLARLTDRNADRKKMLENCLALDPEHTGAKKLLHELNQT